MGQLSEIAKEMKDCQASRKKPREDQGQLLGLEVERTRQNQGGGKGLEETTPRITIDHGPGKSQSPGQPLQRG